jgi:tetratricopeptide (TPR) repeat protein
MRQATEDTDAADRASSHNRPAAAIILMIGLAATAAPGAKSDEPAPVDRVGQRVVARFRGLTLRDDRDAVAGVGDRGRIYRVERVDGRRLWLRAEDKDLGGWASADEVVAVDPPDGPPVRPADPRRRAGFESMLGHSLRHADANVRLRHAEAAAGRKDFDLAIAECTRAIRLDPRDAEAFYLRGSTWASMDRMDQALIDLDESLRLDPRNPASLVARGEIRLALKDYDKALADLDAAIRLGYRDAMAYLDRGEVRLCRGELDPALADLDEAIRRDPWLATAHVHRATVRVKKGEPDKALADLDAAIRIDPRNGSAYDRLAWLRATCPDPRYRDGQRAVEAARRACELLHGREPRELETLAAAYAQAGDFNAAVQWQTRAIAMLSDPGAKSLGESRLKLYQARKPYHEPGP